MDVRSKQPIREHLRKEDVQERILQYIQKGRAEATVTISRAAELFGITENKLRDWEEYGFLNPLRPSGPKGRRLYTPSELDKLAIIRELINAGYAASDIPADIDKLWHTMREIREHSEGSERTEQQVMQNNRFAEPINRRIAQARKDLFWRYFVSHALRLSLMLICEGIPKTAAGLIIPLGKQKTMLSLQQIEEISSLGESLVGWLSQSQSSHTLLTTRPSFQYNTDFRVELLQSRKVAEKQTETQSDDVVVVVQREASPLNLNDEVIETIQRLLKPIYEDTQRSRDCFRQILGDELDPATDFDHMNNNEDVILNGLADMVVRLGGVTAEGQPRWRFCWIMLPKDATQLLHLSNLIIRAQSQDPNAPVRSTITILDKHENHPYMKALQSGHSIYTPRIRITDSGTTIRDTEKPIASSIAVSLGGESGLAIGVLYVASHEVDAFTESDQRVLRLMGRMIEELLRTYHTRQQVATKLMDVIKNPSLIDTFFESFESEREFVTDVEQLLTTILCSQQSETDTQQERYTQHISFIALDIDNLGGIANRYGDRVVRNLTREVGLRVKEQIRTSFKEYPDCQIYHIYADHFLILLKNTSLEQAREHAERLRLGIIGTYKLDALRVSVDQYVRPESMIELPGITVRLGVTSYPYEKLKEILHEYPIQEAVTEVRSIITSALDVTLVRGQVEGGNVVISWNAETHSFTRWSPKKK